MTHNVPMSDTNTPTDLPPGALALPSGGWVVITSTDLAPGKIVRKVRECMDKDGVGSMLNAGYAAALSGLVTDWHFPTMPATPPLPYTNPLILDLIPGNDLLVMEDAVKAWVMKIAGMKDRSAPAADETAPGSPTPPESA